MPNELYFQGQLVKAATPLGGYGYKLTNRFIVGVPDLLIQVPSYATTLIEVKQKPITTGTRLVTVELTPLQENKLKRHQDSGGVAGWLMVAHMRNGEKWVMISSSLDNPQTFPIANYKELSCHMRRSDPWTIPLKHALQMLNEVP